MKFLINACSPLQVPHHHHHKQSPQIDELWTAMTRLAVLSIESKELTAQGLKHLRSLSTSLVELNLKFDQKRKQEPEFVDELNTLSQLRNLPQNVSSHYHFSFDRLTLCVRQQLQIWE